MNTRSLSLHFQNIETDHNLQTSHILCLNEIKVKTQKKSSHQYSNHSKYKSIVTYKGQGTMLLYDRSIVLDSCECVTMSRSKFLATSFNTNTCRAIHIIAIYKPPSLSLTIFLSTLQELISKSSIICPIVVLGILMWMYSKKKLQK